MSRINKSRTVVMTKMAVYDKHLGEADRAAHCFFRRDYIYKKNAVTRFCVGLGAAILAGLYLLRMFFVEGADFFETDLGLLFYNAVLFVLAVLAAYSVVGTVQATRQFYLIQKRLYQYEAWASQLERINAALRERARVRRERAQQEEGAAELYYDYSRTHTDRKRNPR